MSIILKATNISKQYRLGLVGVGTLGDDLKRFWYRVRGKEDPFLKIGEVNNRSTKGESNYVWALQDINFEVAKGEVLGIIGKNGAGKSTLLKILSRVTSPTTGEIKTKGKIASLLEVGTGFHPELTGRENIYLNGAILGMTKSEIRQKESEIIDFSGCERYVDTPVKRYSSGMRVRLAFAVAAFLEPDILVVDEVLAVGDAEFQKKAINKMQDISRGDGRTVLFVSHNMAAVKSLCTRAVVLEHGKISFEGNTDQAINYYLNNNSEADSVKAVSKRSLEDFNNEKLQVNAIQVFSEDEDDILALDKPITFSIVVNKKEAYQLDATLKLKDERGNFFLTTSTIFSSDVDNESKIGELKFEVEFPEFFFSANQFMADVLLVENKNKIIFNLTDILSFHVIDAKKELGAWMGKLNTPLRIKSNWKQE
ncbi:ATP-binding cassette domain-containing protein [Winogradskyella sp. 3972H.M.0a.05]|uniref:ABC transporter ATP-binding protein n=1 Tax=Winogradskyella sp. 3972H.M.0a.05 TaxID=2950277 RepID=UPI0033933C48